jgi:hypothetical protein
MMWLSHFQGEEHNRGYPKPHLFRRKGPGASHQFPEPLDPSIEWTKVLIFIDDGINDPCPGKKFSDCPLFCPEFIEGFFKESS